MTFREFIAKYGLLILPLVLAQVALMTWAIVDWRRRKATSRLPKGLWLVVILLGQIVGPVLYLVFGREDERLGD